MEKFRIGDKVVYYSDSYGELRTGIIRKRICVPSNNDYYLIDTADVYIQERKIMKYDFMENRFPVVPQKKYRKKNYNYLFLTVTKSEGIILHSLKINETDKLGVSLRLLEKFPDICCYNNQLYVLEKEWNFHTRRLASRFSRLYFDLFKCKFNRKFSEWTKIENQNEDRKFLINKDLNIDEVSHILNKDIKYLLSDWRLMYFRGEDAGGNDLVLRLLKDFELDIYFEVKKDLCSDGDEVLV